MKRIACLYTVYSVIEPFTRQLREAVPADTLIHTLYDDFLVTDPMDTGAFSDTNMERLRHDLCACALTGADVIVVSCSTITPGVRRLRGEFSVPIVAVDDAMMRQAVTMGRKIGLIATANSTREPSSQALLAAADEAGKSVDLEVRCDQSAIRALNAGDAAEHDRLVLAMADQLLDRDVIVLAQASTAYMAPAIQERTGIPVVTSPALCIQDVCRILAEG